MFKNVDWGFLVEFLYVLKAGRLCFIGTYRELNFKSVFIFLSTEVKSNVQNARFNLFLNTGSDLYVTGTYRKLKIKSIFISLNISVK
jgi:hypothetical protein